MKVFCETPFMISLQLHRMIHAEYGTGFNLWFDSGASNTRTPEYTSFHSFDHIFIHIEATTSSSAAVDVHNVACIFCCD